MLRNSANETVSRNFRVQCSLVRSQNRIIIPYSRVNFIQPGKRFNAVRNGGTGSSTGNITLLIRRGYIHIFTLKLEALLKSFDVQVVNNRGHRVERGVSNDRPCCQVHSSFLTFAKRTGSSTQRSQSSPPPTRTNIAWIVHAEI